MSKMNPEIKARWVTALRSGEYQQTKNNLRDAKGFCCLGVLCDLYAKEHRIDGWDTHTLGETADGEPTGEELPGNEVCEWAGLDAETDVDICGVLLPLYHHNDGSPSRAPRTFAEIADAIEAQL